MKLTLSIKSGCMVSLTIPTLLKVTSQIWQCSRWFNIPTLTYKTQLASILSICCNIQHPAQQQSQHKLQWSMLQRRTFHHFRLANTATWKCVLHDDIINQMRARAASKQKEHEPLGHCAACDPKRSLRQRNDEKRTSYTTNRKRNGWRIIMRVKPLGHDSKLKTQRQWLGKSRMIQRQVKMRDWRPESLK